MRQAKEQPHETMRYHAMCTTSRTKRDTGIPVSAGVFSVFEERKPQEGECSDAGDKSYSKYYNTMTDKTGTRERRKKLRHVK